MKKKDLHNHTEDVHLSKKNHHGINFQTVDPQWGEIIGKFKKKFAWIKTLEVGKGRRRQSPVMKDEKMSESSAITGGFVCWERSLPDTQTTCLASQHRRLPLSVSNFSFSLSPTQTNASSGWGGWIGFMHYPPNCPIFFPRPRQETTGQLPGSRQ